MVSYRTLLARRVVAALVIACSLIASPVAFAGVAADKVASAVLAPKLYAAIDLGSRGVKAFLYSFVAEAEGLDTRTLFQADINTTLVSGADKTRLTEGGIQEASRAAAKLMVSLKSEVAKLGQDANYYIVGSSGVARFENRDDLKQAVERETGLAMSFVDASQEARFATLSAVPQKRRQVGVAVDLGGSNTKIGCIKGNKVEPLEVPFGSVKLRKDAAEQGSTDADFYSAVERILRDKVHPVLQGCVLERSHVYWVGGAAWATATFVHPETSLWSYVPLTVADLDDFLRRLKGGTWNQGEPRFAFVASATSAQREAIRTRALEDRAKVQNVFSREDLIAGVSLMRAIMMARPQPAARQYFRRDANYIYGWALDKFRPEPQDDGGVSYFAGIDFGSKGVKAFVYSFRQEGEGLETRVEFDKSINHKLASSAQNNRFTQAAIDEATRGGVDLLAQMREFALQNNIDPRFYLVASSGVGSYENRAELKTSVESATGLPLEFIDARAEARYALLAAVPEKRIQESVVVDIGSENTKLGCMTGDTLNTDMIPVGTQKLRTLVSSTKEYEAGLNDVLASVATSYRTVRMNTPCYGNRSRIYFIGGTPWATTTFTRPASVREGWVTFIAQDVESFIDQLRRGTWNQVDPVFKFRPSVSSDTQAAIRKENAVARAAVQGVFSREDLLAGASLLKVILDNANKSGSFYFVRNGNYLFGYAKVKFSDIKVVEDPGSKVDMENKAVNSNETAPHKPVAGRTKPNS